MDPDLPDDEHDDDEDDFEEEEDDEDAFDFADCDFADPGGRSALRAASPSNPRNLPCGDCGRPDQLTPMDVSLGYRCDHCADQAERGW